MVGTVKVVLGRGVVVGGAVGVVMTGSGGGGTVAGGTVAEDWRTVVGGASSAGAVVLVEADDEPSEEPDEPADGVPEDSTVATGAGVFPVRSGTLSGGVASGGLALAMKRLKIWAGREPPLTRRSPWMLYSGLDWPSG